MYVALFGDSQFSDCGSYLAWFYGERGMNVQPHYYPATAPCDWFEVAANWAPYYDIAVVSFMGALFTPCTVGRGTAPQVYAEDIEHLGAIFAWVQRPVLWAGPPGFVGTTKAQNWRLPICQSTAQKYAQYGQRYVDCSDVLRNGNLYQDWKACEHPQDDAVCTEYDTVYVRTLDGAHLTESGRRRFSQRIAYAT